MELRYLDKRRVIHEITVNNCNEKPRKRRLHPSFWGEKTKFQPSEGGEEITPTGV